MECIEMKIQIANLLDDSSVDGEGLRFTVFTQGCIKNPHCPHCHNPQTWDINGGNSMDTEDILIQIKENPLLSGVTFSGGEPFDQPKPLVDLAKKVHALGLNVWSFSGWTLEELKSRNDDDINALLDNIDVLVDGRFVMELRDLTLKFRGSKNQRVIDMNATRESGHIVTLYDD